MNVSDPVKNNANHSPDINRPLRRRVEIPVGSPSFSGRINFVRLFFSISLLVLSAWAGWAMFGNNLANQRPIAVVAIQTPSLQSLGGSDDQHAAPDAETVEKTLPSDSEATAEIRPRRAAPRPAIDFDPAMIELTVNGPLPIIGPSGEKPMDVYAQPSAFLPVGTPGAPAQVALVALNLGLSATETESAVARLPAGVTLAFSPYGVNLRSLSEMARQDGHELMIQLPLEPYDFPQSDPGPHTLRVGDSAEANDNRLDWLLTRIVGYAGATHWRGGRFLSAAKEMRHLFERLQRHGLYFFDAQVQAAEAPQPAAIQIPRGQAHIVIDESPTVVAMQQALEMLRDQALTNGFAVGVIDRPRPGTIELVSEWLQNLPASGVGLVPASAIIAPRPISP